MRTLLVALAMLSVPLPASAVPLPDENSAEWSAQIADPARKTCRTLADIVKAEERAQFLATCFPDMLEKCKQLYQARGFC